MTPIGSVKLTSPSADTRSLSRSQLDFQGKKDIFGQETTFVSTPNQPKTSNSKETPHFTQETNGSHLRVKFGSMDYSGAQQSICGFNNRD